MDIIEVFFNWSVFVASLRPLLSGLLVTIQLGLGSILVGTAGGLIVALVRIYAPKFLRIVATVYIDTMRAMPLLVLLILVYYALPFVGVRFSAFTSATLAISMIAAAYAAEIFRAGIEAIPKGQFEAAQSLGLNYWQMMRDVILPQAFRIVIPPMTNNAIAIMKDTALASVVAMPELLKQATQAQALAANPTPLVGAALIYLVMLLPLVRLVNQLENRFLSRTR